MQIAHYIANLKRKVLRYASAVFLPPIPGNLHSNWPDYFKTHPLSKFVFRRLKRDVYLQASGQFNHLVTRIPADTKHILWVYLGTPQIGDSIMDLSGRVLFKGANFKVDLFAGGFIADTYRGDPFFSATYSDPGAINFAKYDFVILQYLSWKCLKFKIKHLPKTPFLSILGHYYGTEFNRLEYSYSAINHFYASSSAASPIKNASCFNLRYDHSPVQRSPNKVAIGVGGVVDYRTYAHWSEFISLLGANDPSLEIFLVGTVNGIGIAEKTIKEFNGTAKITSLVGQQSTPEVFALLKTVSLLICADGGLLHLGKAAGAPILALFAGPIHPLMRFAPDDAATAIHAPDQVSEISPDQLLIEYLKLRNTQPAHLDCIYIGNEPCCTMQRTLG